MKLLCATNHSDELLERLVAFPVAGVYGKLESDLVGGGRSSILTPSPGRRGFARQVQKARGLGLSYSYLLNASCLDNREFSRPFQRALRRLLDWIVEIGVDRVTVTLPYLAQVVRLHYPQLGITASAFANIDSLRRALFWEELGADQLTLSPVALNRRPRVIREICRRTSARVVLVANNNCLDSCPHYHHHMNLHAHGSQRWHTTRGFVIDPCVIACRLARLKDPTLYLKGDWIRPEDVGRYEELGVWGLKIVNRGSPTDVLLRRVQAYAEQESGDNMLALMEQTWDQNRVIDGSGLARKMRYFFRPRALNPLLLLELKSLRLDKPHWVRLDSARLDGHFDTLERVDCTNTDCDTCGFCAATAAVALEVNEAERRQLLRRFERVQGWLLRRGFTIPSEDGR